jgi:hypothetical protein
MPTDKDVNGNPIPMNARDRADFDRRVKEYKEKDNIAYPELMKACYKNPKTESLCETSDLKTAHEIVARLEKRFRVVNDAAKAAQLLRSLLWFSWKESLVPILLTANSVPTSLFRIWELMSMTRSDLPNSSSRIRRTRSTRLWLTLFLPRLT